MAQAATRRLGGRLARRHGKLAYRPKVVQAQAHCRRPATRRVITVAFDPSARLGEPHYAPFRRGTADPAEVAAAQPLISPRSSAVHTHGRSHGSPATYGTRSSP